MKQFLLLLTLFIGIIPKTISQNRPRPNILFAIADDVTYRYMSAYGCQWIETPAFDRVAKDGILFNNAYTPNAKCAPSRSCILTGRNSWQLEAAANHFPYFPAEFATFPEVLNAIGYAIGFTGKGWAPGIALDQDGNPRNLIGPAFNQQKTKPPTKEISKIDYYENFKSFYTQKTAEQPFFYWYGGNEPHRAYEFGTGESVGGKSITSITEVPAYWPDADSVRHDLLDFALELEYFDQHLGKMLDFLESKGELENTLVVVTADNGLPFPRLKGQAYEDAHHMPLAMMWPEGLASPGRSNNDFVSFIDFAPTFLAVAAIEASENFMQTMTGKSLLPLISNPKELAQNQDRTFVLIGKERHDIGRPQDQGYPIRGIFKESYLYIKNYHPERWPAGNPETGYLNCDGGATKSYILNQRRNKGNLHYWNLNFGKRAAEELYQIQEDPECLKNLADDPHYQNVKEKLATLLAEQLSLQNDPRQTGNSEYFMQFPYSGKHGPNFYERFTAGEEIKTPWINPTDIEPAGL